MITISPSEGKYLTNGVIYTNGELYLPAEADANAWYEVDSVADDDDVEMTAEETMGFLFGASSITKGDAKAKKEMLDTIEALGGLTTKTVQSDKVGFDWCNTYIGDTLIKQEYVEQETPVGTADNPIVYTDGMSLINNAYYRKDGKVYVWMEEWVEME